MKVYRVFNILMVLFFTMAISLPLISVNKTQGKVSLVENRVLASFPKFTTNENKLNTHFIKDFENWFNDNLGFRKELVGINTYLQYTLFGKITRNDTVIGKNNWLYLIYPYMLKSYQNLDLPTEERYKQYEQKFIQLKNYFNKENIPFITMINPDKETIYPENMPDTIKKNGNISKTDLVIDYLSKKKDIDIFTPKNSLISAKANAILFSQNYDLSHWNEKGAFVGYLELMNQVKKYKPDIKVLSWENFNIEQYIRKSKLYGAIPFEETDYKFNFKNGYSSVQERGPLDSLNLNSSNLAFRYVNKSETNLPKALVVGDSYIYLFMLPNIAESFSEVTFVHWNNMGNIKNIVNAVKPDIFILELMEPALDQFTDSISYPNGYFTDYSSLKDLPIVPKPENGLMWLDYSNNELVKSQGKIVIDKDAQSVSLIGWAIDPKVGKVAGDIYLKVADKYYPGTYGIKHTGVSDYFKNQNLTNSGFSFNVNTSELIKAGNISFVIVSNDKTYQYTPVEFKVETR